MEKIKDMGMRSKKICGRCYNSYDCNSDRCYKEIEKLLENLESYTKRKELNIMKITI